MGLGFGLAMPQVTALAMDAVPLRDSGPASRVVNTTQQAGGAVGLAVVAVIAASQGRAAGFVVAAGALVAGGLVAAYLTAVTARTVVRRPTPLASGDVGTPTLERC